MGVTPVQLVRVVMVGFGAGLAWAAAGIEWTAATVKLTAVAAAAASAG